MLLQPDVILFDEPTSALDPALTGEVVKLIKSLGEKGISNLIITHDMEFANNVSDRVFSMKNGKIQEGLIF